MTQIRPTPDTFTPTGYGSPGLFALACGEWIGRKAAAAGLSLLSTCVTCATLDSMILYNRPRTRGEVRGLLPRGLRAIIRDYDLFGGCTADAVRPLSLYVDARQQDTDDEQRGGRLGRCGDAGGRHGRRREASPRADLGGGWGADPLSDEADRMTTRTTGRTLPHYMVETAPGCWAIMPQIMPRRGCSGQKSQQYIG